MEVSALHRQPNLVSVDSSITITYIPESGASETELAGLRLLASPLLLHRQRPARSAELSSARSY